MIGRPFASNTAPLFAGAFVLAVDAAGIGHLLPALETATHAPPGGRGAWFVTVFVLGSLVGSPLLARVAEGRGRIHLLRRALFGFAFASAVVGASSSFALTLLARFAQGFAGSAVIPLSAAHLEATAARGFKGRSVSLLSLWYAVGFVAGIAFVSLFLLVSFRGTYFFTAALAGGAATAMGSVAESSASETPREGPSGTRVVGWFFALALAVVALSYPTPPDGEVGALASVHRAAIRGAEIAAAPAVVLFAWVDAYRPPSLLPPDSFRSRAGIASACMALVAGLGQASIVVMPTCGMQMLGVSAAASGPLLVPVLVGGVAANVLAAARLDRWGSVRFLVSGAALAVAADVLTARFGACFAAFEASALLLGAGVSLLSSGALRHLAASYGKPNDADARQAAVSLLTNVGLMSGGALWGATVRRVPGVSGTCAGLFTLACAMIPLSAALLLLATRDREDRGGRPTRPARRARPSGGTPPFTRDRPPAGAH